MQKRRFLLFGLGVASTLAIAVPAAHALDACLPHCGVLQGAVGSSIHPKPDAFSVYVSATVSVADGAVVVSRGVGFGPMPISLPALPSVNPTTGDGGPVATVVGLTSPVVGTAGAAVNTVKPKLAHLP